MDERTARHLLQQMIDYFEAGNQESDGAAKAILASDSQYRAQWQREITELLAGVDWTGLRAPEADIVAAALRCLQRLLPNSL